MKAAWKNWEEKVARIFEHIGFQQIQAPEKWSSLPVRSFCMERINREMQVDIFVRVDESTWIAIECRDRRNATIKDWLHEIKGRCADRASKIRKELKKKTIVYGVAATSLKSLNAATEATASDTGIALWHHGLVDYLLSIAKGARSQVESFVLFRCGIRKKEYPAISLNLLAWPDRRDWFSGFVTPSQIAEAAFVYQRGQGFGESAYQRFLKPKRIEEIAEFIRNKGSFPNSIVLALPAGTRLPPRERRTGLVSLTVPGEPEAIKIIDGQHRFFGALASGRDTRLLCTFVLTDDLEQAIMFAKINGKQVSVSQAQLISLFGIPGFAAKIASGVSERDYEKVLREETVYRALEALNESEPLKESLNFYPGRPSGNLIPFKTLFDTVVSISKKDQSMFGALPQGARERGKAFGQLLANFLGAWESKVGQKDFRDRERWFQPTMLAAMLLTYPDCRWNAKNREASDWLRSRSFKRWNPRPESYRGGGGASILARQLLQRVGAHAECL